MKNDELKVEIKFMPGEKICWVGSPNFNNNSNKNPFWKILNSFFDTLEYLGLFFIVCFMTFLYFRDVIGFEDYILFPMLLIGLISIIISWNYIERKNLLGIKYILTNKRVIYQSWNLFKGYQMKDIALKNIQKFSLEEFENEKGTIHFMGMELSGDKNVSLSTGGSSKHYPTLELIENAKDLLPVIEKLIKENKEKGPV